MVKKVLIANDEPDLINVIKFRLRKTGYEIFVAANGQETVDLAKKHKPDVIVMDYHMPILNGAEACQQIKSDPELKAIPILLLTSSLNVSEIQTVNADDYIQIVDLIEKIKKWTHRRE